jgi:hypothetical protein
LSEPKTVLKPKAANDKLSPAEVRLRARETAALRPFAALARVFEARARDLADLAAALILALAFALDAFCAALFRLAVVFLDFVGTM